MDSGINHFPYKTDDLAIYPGDHRDRLNDAFEVLEKEQILDRIWDHDHTVWKDDPTDIQNRLGWLHSPGWMKKNVKAIRDFTHQVLGAGLTRAVLIGMGGSSLAPEVFRNIFGVKEGFMDLSILDSTHPETIRAKESELDYSKTLFIVSTKSGGTVETLSLLKYFYHRAVDRLGRDMAGNHFIAITDSGSRLEKLGIDHGFRKIFLNDPDIGGRFSVLSYFGLVPAALIGLTPDQILENAARAAERSVSKTGEGPGPSAALLGAALGSLAMAGVDKMTLITPPELAPFCPWIEQLIAESTGKEKKGILPVLSPGIKEPGSYRDDRVFVCMQLEGEHHLDGKMEGLVERRIPLICLPIKKIQHLPGEFFRWEMATAIACAYLEINPFNQPNVEAAKVRARETLAEFETEGRPPRLKSTQSFTDIDAVSDLTADTPSGLLGLFLDQAVSEIKKDGPGGYVALHAYLPVHSRMDKALEALRTRIEERFSIAVTLGYGPRFLHSTGQLHKGDAGNGFFIQLTDESINDIMIPDGMKVKNASVSFRVLIDAQAMGDRQALIDSGRKVIRFQFKNRVIEALNRLAGEL